MDMTSSNNSNAEVSPRGKVRRLDGNGKEARSAKFVRLESSGDRYSRESLDGSDTDHTSLQRNVISPETTKRSIDCIEYSEIKTDDDKCDEIQHSSILQEAKQAPAISIDHNNESNRRSPTFPEIGLPSDESDGNENDLPSESRNALQAQDITETEDEASSSSSDSSSDSSSESSEDDSLLSTWSDDASQQGILPELYVSSKYQGIKRLEKQLEQRKKRLKRLCEGQPPAYVYMLKQNEKLAAKIKVAEYVKENSDEILNPKVKKMLESKGREPRSTFGILQFEWIHTLPCAYVLFVCMAVHTTFFGVTDCAFRILYATVLEPMKVGFYTFYVYLMLLGFTLLRFNGGIFYYSSTMAYHRAQMEMSNRLRIGMFDARLFKRIKGNIIGSYFNMFGYYLISVGISKFYYGAYHFVYAKVDAGIGLVWQAATELINAEVKEKQAKWEYIPLGLSEGEDLSVSPSCKFAVDQVSKTLLKPFFLVLCADTTFEYKSLELFFHTSCLLLIAYLSHRVGRNAMKACD